MKKWVEGIALVLVFFAAVPTWATVDADLNSEVKTYKQWKQQQVMDAENQFVRLSNKIHILKSKSFDFVDAEERTPEEDVKAMEGQLQQSLENLEYARELTVDDYFEVYLAHFKDRPGVLESVALQMSPEVVTRLLRIALKASKTEAKKLEPKVAEPEPQESAPKSDKKIASQAVAIPANPPE